MAQKNKASRSTGHKAHCTYKDSAIVDQAHLETVVALYRWGSVGYEQFSHLVPRETAVDKLIADVKTALTTARSTSRTNDKTIDRLRAKLLKAVSEMDGSLAAIKVTFPANSSTGGFGFNRFPRSLDGGSDSLLIIRLDRSGLLSERRRKANEHDVMVMALAVCQVGSSQAVISYGC
jgi:hypothetical protein